jgi:HD superfamily phosphohydrolase
MMLWLIRVFLLCILFTSCQRGEIVQTFYGPIEVKEPVLLELIHSAPMQRLKQVHQYGVAYYTKTHPEEYNRFDHSLGVFAILRIKGASLVEQIAGLLHDISHSAFSHVGDWVYAKENQENDYHSSVHEGFVA